MIRRCTLLCLMLFLGSSGFAKEADRTTLSESGGAVLNSPEALAALPHVISWIRDKVPLCPPTAAAGAAQKFLDEIRVSNPIAVGQIAGDSFSFRPYASRLLRYVGAQLTAPDQVALRESVARLRLEALALDQEGRTLTNADVTEQLASIRGVSEVYVKRLFEGKTDDDDLISLLRRAKQAKSPVAGQGTSKAKVLSASDIVSEFSQHNQRGGAAARLRTYVIDSVLVAEGGKPQRLVLSRMSGGRFRLQVSKDGKAALILLSDGKRYWTQSPGREAKMIFGEGMDGLDVLGEFLDPLFVPDDFRITRLPDGEQAGQKVYRLSIVHPDGTSHIACIDKEDFRQVARENPDGSVIVYSDFRDISGVTFAFREESRDKKGRRSVLQISRVSVNCGIVEELFQPSATSPLEYFALSELFPPNVKK